MRTKDIELKRGGRVEKFPIHFGFNTQADFCEEQGISISEFEDRLGGDKMSLSDIRSLAFHAFKHGFRRTKAIFNLSLDNIGDLFDENPNAIADIFKILLDSQPKPAKEGETEGEQPG